jgi:chemotaxis protein CheX
MHHDLERLLAAAVEEVFSTMLNCPVQVVEPSTNHIRGEPLVAGVVGFAGRLNGLVYIYATESFAPRITGRILGVAPETAQPPEMVNDAMSELANMVVGHMKSRLAERWLPCQETIPWVMRGRNVTAQSVGAEEQYFITFRCDGGEVVAQVIVESIDGSN